MNEKDLELAEALAERLNESGRARCAKQALPDGELQPEEYKAEDCTECEDPLPEFRKKKGLTLCVNCQSVIERAKRR